MSELVPSSEIEKLVGAKRHSVQHIGAFNSYDGNLYILHSQACLDSGIDLRDCEFSKALDSSFFDPIWNSYQDIPVVLSTHFDRLMPVAPVGEIFRPS